MASAGIDGTDLRDGFEPLVEIHDFHELYGTYDVFQCEAGFVVFVGVGMFLDLRAVLQEDLRQNAGSGRAEDGTIEALGYEFGQEPRVVDMCVGEEYDVDGICLEAEVLVERDSSATHALKKAAVEEYLLSIVEGDQMFGACDCGGSAVKGYLHNRVV